MIQYIFCLWLSFFLFPVFAQVTKAQKIIVSGPSPYLVKTVQEIHNKKGNIFDSTIAGAFTLSVTHPYFVSLACGGFALIANKDEVEALDFREVAPSKMTPDFYVKSGLSSLTGGAAVGVPGFVDGLWAIHKKYGSLPWKVLLRPAIQLAEKGFPVSGDWFDRTRKSAKKFGPNGKTIFLRRDGNPYPPNEVLRQKRLAKALRILATSGRSAFYGGPIGTDVIEAVKANKGIMTADDLENYQVDWLRPIFSQIFGFEFYGMPLPSSGGLIVARAIQLTRLMNKQTPDLYSIREWHSMGGILSFAFRPRIQMGDLSNSMGDPSWLSHDNLKKLVSRFSFKKVVNLPPLNPNALPSESTESTETTHFSLMNDKNQAVSMTLTLNGIYGSSIVTSKYGIVLNNQMDDFNTRPGQPNQFGLIQGKNNEVRGGHRPLSSMSPTLVKKEGKVRMVLGGSGGPMIISSVFQVLYRHLINNFDLDEAIQAPRIHHQFLPRILYYEKNRFFPSVLEALKRLGYQLKKRDSIAKIYAVATDQEGNFLEGAFDHRGEGMAGGH